MEKPVNKKKKYLMALCILAPLAAMVLLVLNRTGAVSIGGYLPIAMLLLCPLSHLLMLPLMHKATSKGSNSGESDDKPGCH